MSAPIKRIFHIYRILNPVILATIISREHKTVLAGCNAIQNRDQWKRKYYEMIIGAPAETQGFHNVD